MFSAGIIESAMEVLFAHYFAKDSCFILDILK